MSRSTPTLAAYGKLPCYAEYVKVRCLDANGRALRDWIDGGFQLGGARLGGRWRVLEMGQTQRDGGEPATATVRDSRDASGRAFAFVCYCTGGIDQDAGSVLDLVRSATELWRELARCDDALARETQLDSIKSAVIGWQLGMRARPPATEPLLMEQWAELLFAAGDPKDQLVQLLWELRRVLRGLRDGTAGTDGRLSALRLPLSPLAGAEEQVLLWMRALTTGGMRPARRGLAGLQVHALAYPEDLGPTSALFVYPRPLRGGDYRLLPSPGAGLLQPPPAAPVRADATGYSVFRAAVERFFDLPTAAADALAQIPFVS